MRRMYREFYLESPNSSYYLRGRGYKSEDFERVASEVAGFDLADFFARYVRGVETPPYKEALAQVGLRLIRRPASEPYSAGIVLDWEDPRVVKIRTVRNNSPAESAGLSQGDVLVSIGGTNVTRDNWLAALKRFKQGDRVPFTVRRDRRTIQTTVTLGPPDRYDYRIEENKNAPPEARALRTAWTTKSSAE
jgi:predicted metalloprotease with PDZ domain